MSPNPAPASFSHATATHNVGHMVVVGWWWLNVFAFIWANVYRQEVCVLGTLYDGALKVALFVW